MAETDVEAFWDQLAAGWGTAFLAGLRITVELSIGGYIAKLPMRRQGMRV